MGFRFRRSVRLTPGLRINPSKMGASLSLDRRGATVNFSDRGTKVTIGLPGSGLSYSEMLHSGPPTTLPSHGPSAGLALAAWLTVGFLALAAIIIALISGESP
jgi:hypothetical protein